VVASPDFEALILEISAAQSIMMRSVACDFLNIMNIAHVKN
jgi:hypothetical protein